MKKLLFVLFIGGLLGACLLSQGCTWGLRTEQSIYVIQPYDSTILQKVCVEIATYDKRDDRHYSTEKYSIPTYPKAYEDAPLFTEMDYAGGDFEGTVYDVCELATKQKYIALHDGYYIAYPYTKLSILTTFLDVEWNRLCDVDLDTINPISFYQYDPFNCPYKKVYVVEESLIAKLSKKSTLRFRKCNKEEVTISDAIKVINMLIDEGKLDECCQSVGLVVK